MRKEINKRFCLSNIQNGQYVFIIVASKEGMTCSISREPLKI